MSFGTTRENKIEVLKMFPFPAINNTYILMKKDILCIMFICI